MNGSKAFVRVSVGAEAAHFHQHTGLEGEVAAGDRLTPTRWEGKEETERRCSSYRRAKEEPPGG